MIHAHINMFSVLISHTHKTDSQVTIVGSIQ